MLKFLLLSWKVTVENLLKGVRMMSELPSRFLVGEDGSSLEMVVMKTLSGLSQADVVPLFPRLMFLAYDDIDSSLSPRTLQTIRNQASKILDQFLRNLELQVRSEVAFKDDDIPILSRVDQDLTQFIQRLFSRKELERQYVFRLLCLLCWARGLEKANSVITRILFIAQTDSELESLIAFFKVLRPYYPNLCEIFVEKLESNFLQESNQSTSGGQEPLKNTQKQCSSQWLKNLAKLLHWEDKSPLGTDCKHMRLKEAAQNQYGPLVLFLLRLMKSSDNEQINHGSSISIPLECLTVIECIGTPLHQSPKHIWRISHLLVDLILEHLRRSDTESLEVFNALSEFGLFLIQNQAPFTEDIFLRSLVCSAFRENSWLFGDEESQPSTSSTDQAQISSPSKTVMLMEENRKEGERQKKLSNMVHSGVIGKGLKRKAQKEFQEGPVSRRLQFVYLIDRLCEQGSVPRWGMRGGTVAMEEKKEWFEYKQSSCKLLGDILRENLCLDCIAAEFIWEDWNYAKLNLERYLKVLRCMEEVPFAWDLLFIVAEAYPALWFCYPVLKCILGGIMVQLESAIDKTRGRIQEKHLKTLENWFLLTAKGEMLPDLMCSYLEILNHVPPYEGFVVLLDIWKYFQSISLDKNGLEQQFNRITLKLGSGSGKEESDRSERMPAGKPEDFRETSIQVIQSHVEKLGYLLPEICPEICSLPDENLEDILKWEKETFGS